MPDMVSRLSVVKTFGATRGVNQELGTGQLGQTEDPLLVSLLAWCVFWTNPLVFNASRDIFRCPRRGNGARRGLDFTR